MHFHQLHQPQLKCAPPPPKKNPLGLLDLGQGLDTPSPCPTTKGVSDTPLPELVQYLHQKTKPGWKRLGGWPASHRCPSSWAGRHVLLTLPQPTFTSLAGLGLPFPSCCLGSSILSALEHMAGTKAGGNGNRLAQTHTLSPSGAWLPLLALHSV